MRYPLVNLREFISLGPETLNPVMEVLSWSFGQLAAGYHPRHDMHGNPYQGKFTAGNPIAGLNVPVKAVPCRGLKLKGGSGLARSDGVFCMGCLIRFPVRRATLPRRDARGLEMAEGLLLPQAELAVCERMPYVRCPKSRRSFVAGLQSSSTPIFVP